MEDPSAFGAFEDAPVDTVKRGRGNARDSMMLAASMTREDRPKDLVQLRVRNLSPGGLMADCPAAVDRGCRVTVELRNIGEVSGVIAWARDGRIGVAFEREVDPLAARRPVGQAKLKTSYVERVKPTKRPGVRIG